MARYLILDSNNKVTNAIEWDGIAKFNPPKDHILRLEPNEGNPGDTFNGRNLVPPPPLPKSKEESSKEEIIAVDDDPLTTGVFQRFITATRNKLGI